MSKQESSKNPFANKDGSPKDDFMAEFFDWEEKKREAEISKLPKEEQEKIRESAEALARRMQS